MPGRSTAYLMCCLSCLSLTAGTHAAPDAGGNTGKSVVFFLVDDGGFESPVWGNTGIETPHISALAGNGTIFERAYTAVSSCSPSRSAILSGLPTHQNGMYGLHQNPGNFQSNADVTSLPNILHAAGYKVGILGKHHVGPLPNYNFTYGTTAEHCWAGALGNRMTDLDLTCHADYNQVSRNITNMKLNAREFLTEIEPTKPFFLYVGFGDVHRCGFKSAIGSFCEFYGTGQGPSGKTIPDWPHPKFYSPEDVQVPPFLPDNQAVREDIAGQWTAWHRLDAGVGVLLGELRAARVLDNTLVVFTSDNGIPFPSGKTNLLEQGQHEPLLISTPAQRAAAAAGIAGGIRNAGNVVSLLDLMPTILDWTGTTYPANARARGSPARLTGSSLLPLVRAHDDEAAATWRDTAFGSHNFHSLYAYYPTRSMVTPQYRLIHNLNYNLKYPILEDVYHTDTWSALMAIGEAGNSTQKQAGWVYDYKWYMHRPEWQLFDVQADPLGLTNLAKDPKHAATLQSMQKSLHAWRVETSDPWIVCNPAVPGSDDPWLQSHSSVCAF